jgi:TrmH RNA methyltransferase
LNEKDAEARLTTSAYRIAEGGFEHLTVRKISNSSAFLKDASKKLLTIGTDTRARQRIGDLSGIVKNRRGVVLVLGNEETGLPKEVKDQCSCLLRIPGTGNIDSLNVAQAAALFLHAIYGV